MSIEIRGLGDNELEVHNQLAYECYRQNAQRSQALANPQWWLKNIHNDPYYRPEQTRVLFLDGKMVATVTNFQREMYCAGRRAKVSGIGNVGTHPDHRRKGFVREVLEESKQWMRENRFDFSFLFGDEQVYGGSGWHMFSAFEAVAAVRLPKQDTGLTVRQAQFPEDIPALHAIYDEFNERLTGTFVRSRAYWERRVVGGYFTDRTREFNMIEEAGQPVAYYRSSGAGIVSELGWRRDVPDIPARAVGTILRQWPAVTETRFSLCTRELRAALDSFIWAPSLASYRENRNALRLAEEHKGLWSYIGPGEGKFPEVTDFTSLAKFLREKEYVFWSGVDSF